jgi:Tautomerase enzyme
MISSGVYRFFGMMRPPWLRSSLTFILDQFYPGRSLVRVLNKTPAQTFVVIDEVDTENWGVAGMCVQRPSNERVDSLEKLCKSRLSARLLSWTPSERSAVVR